MSNAIDLENTVKTFTSRTWRTLLLRRTPTVVQALRGVTLAIPPGEIFGLLGPNGAGKTTLIKILATLILPDAGRATVRGFDLQREPQRARRLIGLVNTAERSFYWRLTGRQNLAFFAALHDLRGKAKQMRIEEVLALVGVEDKAGEMFMKYSEGQKQRLALARALLHDPQVLFMDEPTKSLDPLAASAMIALAKEELAGRKGKTILWCTHNLKEAETVCTRLAILHKGLVISSGTVDQLRSFPGTASLYEMRIGQCSAEILKAIGISPLGSSERDGRLDIEFEAAETEIPSLIRKLTENGISVRACRNKPVELEAVFEHLVRHAD